MNMCSMQKEIDMVILCFAVLSRDSFLLKGNTKACRLIAIGVISFIFKWQTCTKHHYYLKLKMQLSC